MRKMRIGFFGRLDDLMVKEIIGLLRSGFEVIARENNETQTWALDDLIHEFDLVILFLELGKWNTHSPGYSELGISKLIEWRKKGIHVPLAVFVAESQVSDAAWAGADLAVDLGDVYPRTVVYELAKLLYKTKAKAA